MLRPLFFSQRAAHKAVNLIAMLLVSVCSLSRPAITHANPIVIYILTGKVHVIENGLPSDKVDSVKLVCQYTIFEWVQVVEESGTSHPEGRDIPQTFTSTWHCQRGECPFDTKLETGGGSPSCNWVVITPDRATINYPWTPEGVEFKDVYIDIATGAITDNPTPPALPGLLTFLVALVLAWLVEIPVIFLMLRYVFRPRYTDTKRLLGVSFLATLMTLPFAWYALPYIRMVITLTPWVYIALVESFVVVVEALIFARFLRIPVWQAALVSLVANGLSFLVGLVVL